MRRSPMISSWRNRSKKRPERSNPFWLAAWLPGVVFAIAAGTVSAQPASTEPAGQQPISGPQSAPLALVPLRDSAAKGLKREPPYDALRQEDFARLLRLEASRKRGLAAAAAGNRANYRLAVSIIEAPAQVIDAKRLPGRWLCRTFSLGGNLGPKFAASKTSFFRCRIIREGNGYTVKKTSGSMAWLGRLRAIDGKQMLYYGSAIARGDRIPVYPEKRRFSSHQVGVLEQISRNRLRMEMPEPVHRGQSFHDLIELVRQR